MLMFFMKNMKKSKKGFTLTELIVVVAILGVLATVATPLFADQIKNAKDTTDKANAKTMENILKVYVAGGKDAPADATAAKKVITDNIGSVPLIQNTGNFYNYDKSKVTVTIVTSDPGTNAITAP